MTMESSGKKKFLAVILFLVVIAVPAMVWNFWAKPAQQKKELVKKQEAAKKQEEQKQKIQKATGSDSGLKNKVVLRADAFTGYCFLRSEEMKKQLKSQSINLVVEDDKADYIARMKALQSGECDMAVFTIDSFIAAGVQVGEFPASIVAVIDESKGADAIVAYKSAVKSFADLNRPDARFVLTANSPSEFLARVVVSEFNLNKVPDRSFIPADGAGEVFAKFRKAKKTEPKAYVLWEPYVTRALASDPDAYVVFGSDKLRGYVVDVIVARRKFLVDNYDVAKAVVEAYFRSAYFYSQDQGDLAGLVVDDSKLFGENLSRDEAGKLMKGIQWKNTLENYSHFRLLSRQDSGGLDDMEDMIAKVMRVLVGTGAISGDAVKAKPNELYFDKILKDLQATNFHPAMKLGGVVNGGVKAETIQADVVLPELSEEDWKTLISVGEMRIPPIAFMRGTDELGSQGKQDLDELIVRLKSMPMYYLLVMGNARAEGDADANMKLAEARAKAVADYLSSQDIGKNRIRVVAAKPSFGSEQQSVTFQLLQRKY